MKTSSVCAAFFGLLLSSVVTGAPEAFLERRHCQNDKCYSSLVRSGTAAARSSCSASLIKTITPSPTTVTKFKGGITTVRKPKLTTTITTTSVQIETDTSVTLTTTTVELDSTIISTESTAITTTDVVTETDQTTTTTPVTSALPTGPARREIEDRHYNTPPSVCSNTKSYSAACDCLGVCATTTTLPRKTVYTTISKVLTISLLGPATTTSTTATVQSATTVQSTSIIPETTVVETTETTTATEVLSETATTTTTETAVVTQTISPSTAPFLIADPNGNRFFFGGTGTLVTNGQTINGVRLLIEGNGSLRRSSVATTYFTINAPGDDVIRSQTGAPPQENGVFCQLSMPQTASGRLTCTASGGRIIFNLCGNTLSLSDQVLPNCSEIIVTATPVG